MKIKSHLSAKFPKHSGDLTDTPNDNVILKNESNTIVLLAFYLCLISSVINYIYFYFFTEQLDDFKHIITRSIVLFLFGLGYLTLSKCEKFEIRYFVLLVGITIGVTSYMVISFYSFIGPAIWSFMFLVLFLMTTRDNIYGVAIMGSLMLVLAAYLFIFNANYNLDLTYYVAQIIGFIMNIVVSIIIFYLNIKKNSFIRTQHSKVMDTNQLLVETNNSLMNEIQEHRRIQDLLIHTENRFEAMVKALPDVVFTIDYNGYFIDCEKGNNEWLLYEKSDFLGKSLEDLMPKKVAIESLEFIRLSIDTGTKQIYEYMLELPEGEGYYEARINKISSNEAIVVLRDVTELKRRQNEIEYMSYHDHLTDVYNRRFYETELDRLDTERNYPLTIVVIDINGLKLVNDAFGHAEGDRLIIRIANSIKSECRIDDIVARVGGDEFVVLLPKTSREDAQKIMYRINDKISQFEHESYCVSIAAGCVTKKSKNEMIKDIIHKAEEKMYHNKITESQKMRYKTIQSIKTKLNETIHGEQNHCIHSVELCKKVGLALNFDKEMLIELEQMAQVHDIGKIAVDEKILNKPGNLTEKEYSEIKRHSEIGYQILKATDIYASVAEYVLYHHEHWDGKGYPKGISGEQIPRYSRILSIVEAYDAMTTAKPYRVQMSPEEAIAELIRCSGTQFDPQIVSVFIEQLELSHIILPSH